MHASAISVATIDDFFTSATDERLFLRTVLLPDGVNDTEGDGDKSRASGAQLNAAIGDSFSTLPSSLGRTDYQYVTVGVKRQLVLRCSASTLVWRSHYNPLRATTLRVRVPHTDGVCRAPWRRYRVCEVRRDRERRRAFEML